MSLTEGAVGEEATISDKRIKKLTVKAEETYKLRLEKYQTKLIAYRKNIEQTIILFKTTENLSKSDTIQLQQKLNSCYETYELVMQELSVYLSSLYTEESLKELDAQNIIHRTVSESVVSVLNNMEMIIKNVTVKAPSVTRQSQRSYATSTRTNQSSVLIATQKAKLQAAKTKLEFEKKEVALKQEKAELDAKMELLEKEKDVAVETAVLEILEEELDQRSQHGSAGIKDNASIPEKFEFIRTPKPNPPKYDPMFDAPSLVSGLDPKAKPFEPEIPRQFADLSSYLLKRDLLMERFYHFDDKPETFNIWKTSFCSILSELKATPSEEFDLLLKYLGPESRVYAQSIRQSNAYNLSLGVQLLWERLHERFGSPELIEKSLKQRLQKFPRITVKDSGELYKLSDLCNEVESTKQDPKYSQLLSYFDSSTGVQPIVEKLPVHLQSKWVTRASNYKQVNNVYFPPFREFCAFLKEMSVMLNDPGLCVSYPSANKGDKTNSSESKSRSKVHVNKTVTDTFVANSCPFHRNTSSHSLNDCKTFKRKSVSERKRFLKDNNICYKCCNANSHNFKTCNFVGRCSDCGSDRHPSALHYFQSSSDQQQASKDGGKGKSPPKDHGREQLPINGLSVQFPKAQNDPSPVVNGCTNICGKGSPGKSCSKTILVKVHPVEHPEKTKIMYCIIDDQSNRTLCKSELFQMWNTDLLSVGVENYDLVSCSGRSLCSGRTLNGLIVSSLDNNFSVELPTILECDMIPDTRREIPTPEITEFHEHLRGIPILPLQSKADIVLLIGRDVPEVHHVYEQRIAVGKPNAPFAQRLGFGWVIIGEVCLNSHKPDVKVMKTYIHSDGRPSLFKPCESKFKIKPVNLDQVEDDIFVETKHDNEIGLSIEDSEFLTVMEQEFCKDETNHWSAPLPFRTPRSRLPNNRSEAYRRAMSFDSSLRRNPTKLQHSLDFMGNLIDKGYCERAFPLQDEEECWYLPLFGVYHPKKKDKIRIVFDSSSKFHGVSLNNVLMTGPDLTNNLIGILMRFRKEKIALTGDIEQMFYQFRVNENHRNYLRFLWYEDNDFNKPLVEYRMCVHVFGNSPSPAIATYGLRKTAHVAAEKYDKDVVKFVDNDFYVDDGLTSVTTETEAVELIRNTQFVLKEEGNLRFHKIASNSVEVLKCLPEEDLAKDLKHSQIGVTSLPVQRSLGLCWDLNIDCFIFQTFYDNTNNYTKRSVLSVINSLFDPLGFLAPFTITGKLLLRDITNEAGDWDEPLPEHLSKEWKNWLQSLPDLESLTIPRVYFSEVKFKPESQLHVFCDASEKAIASVAYLKTATEDENSHVAFVFGKCKVAPKHGHTIPRLELCAAVLGVEIAETVSRELSISPEKITYYTDSKVVLGYLANKTRRFYVYVQNRVSRVLKFSRCTQWRYIETDQNPADIGTRGISSSDLQNCSWLSGGQLKNLNCENKAMEYPLENPEKDLEIRPTITSMKTEVKLGTSRFEKFSTWKKLIIAISLLTHFVKCFKNKNCIEGSYKTEDAKSRAQDLVISQVQFESYGNDIQCLKEKKTLPRNSSVLALAPFLDENNILRVGGRLKHSDIPEKEKMPILIPGRSHIAMLLVRHFHENVCHQGRHFTEGAIRSAGFWITGGKRLIANVIHRCVTCRKLRGKFSEQKMSNLPTERVTPTSPFTFVGVDVFGPWSIVTRRTRGGAASSKRWAVMFTCLASRAIHIELIEEMSSSSFINALRRFEAIRGHVKIFRSDRGTNFVGATDSLKVDVINVEDRNTRDFLYNTGSVWIFNPPHASHMGGSWERMIGVTRRILDAILLQHKHRPLTHDVLLTFMAEVSAIVNARPIVPVSTDCADPTILTPSVLLTQKIGNSSQEVLPQLSIKDMYKSQWKFVQILADQFWKKWRSEFLAQLQRRSKWTTSQPNLREGDVVLLKDSSVNRNQWPVAIVTQTFPSSDSLIRTVQVKVVKDGKPVFYTRPISELVLLISD